MSTQLWLTLAANVISGLAYPAIHIGISTLILTNAEEAFVGRVNGFLTPLFMGAMVLTMGLSGWVKASVPLVSMYAAAGVLFIVAVVIMIPLLKEARSHRKRPDRAAFFCSDYPILCSPRTQSAYAAPYPCNIAGQSA
ncbi:hypothetical protein LJK87_21255 [Paenibacillus sp. P25]|nr:hypothetical protein LJK87_21255 [Paenibacillus sp. P25]